MGLLQSKISIPNQAFVVLANEGVWHINQTIFEHISDTDLCHLRLVCKTLKTFIDNQKYYLQQRMKNHSNDGISVMHKTIGLNKIIAFKYTMLVLDEDVNDKHGRTAWHWAAYHGNIKVLQILNDR